MVSKDYIYKEFIPSHQLKNYIDCYWFFSHLMNEPLNYSIIPDGCFDLVFKINDNELSTSRITGIWEEKFDIQYNKPTQLFGIRFKIGSLYRLLDYPIKNILNKSEVIQVNDLGIPKQYIDDALSDNYINLINALENHFIYKLNNSKYYKNIEVFQYFGKLQGNESINNISKVIGLSSRQLRRIFNQELGLSPKKVLKIIRFKSFMDCPDKPLYFDQSHFIKDYKSICKTVPNLNKNNNDVRFLQYPQIN